MNTPQPEKQQNQDVAQPGRLESMHGTLAMRSLCGGLMMGLANLVPGISGGTMLLAAGVYPQFIEAVSDVSRLRIRFQSMLVLGCVVIAGGLAILLLAGPLKTLVVSHRWVMYSLFIGLTLGGVPVVWRLAKPATTSLTVGAVLAFLAMVGLAVLKANNVAGSGGSNFTTLFGAGLAGASAMILPGLSGGYLLLLLGQYLPILGAIDEFKEALKAGDMAAAISPGLNVMLPVGIGVVLGVAVVGNVLQWLLKQHRKPTLGALLGLLLGSVVGLYPFQVGVKPVIGEVIKAQVVTAENISNFDEEDWRPRYYAPTPTQLAGSLLMVAIGVGVTMAIAKIGGEQEESLE